MGFLDKAKKMAEQAQAKLDEAQKQFNDGQGGQRQGGGPAVEYDKHGRPIPQRRAAPTPRTPPRRAPPRRRAPPPAATPGVPPTERAADAARRPRAGAADARPGRAGHARRRRARRRAAGRRAGPGAARGPQPPELRAAEALERRPARGLTPRSAPTACETVAMRPYEGLLTAMVTPFHADGASTRRRPSRSPATCSPTAPTGSWSPARPARPRR